MLLLQPRSIQKPQKKYEIIQDDLFRNRKTFSDVTYVEKDSMSDRFFSFSFVASQSRDVSVKPCPIFHPNCRRHRFFCLEKKLSEQHSLPHIKMKLESSEFKCPGDLFPFFGKFGHTDSSWKQ